VSQSHQEPLLRHISLRATTQTHLKSHSSSLTYLTLALLDSLPAQPFLSSLPCQYRRSLGLFSLLWLEFFQIQSLLIFLKNKHTGDEEIYKIWIFLMKRTSNPKQKCCGFVAILPLFLGFYVLFRHSLLTEKNTYLFIFAIFSF
jgi:hypothetical protein